MLVFHSRTFPADTATDPSVSDSEARGLPLLTFLVEKLHAKGVISEQVSTSPHGHGSSVYVVCDRVHISIHLAWYIGWGLQRNGPVVWTLQVGKGLGCWRALRRAFGFPHLTPGNRLEQAIETVLRDHPDEFSNVRWCTWEELERL